jgi:hypothetical protein
MVTGGAAFAGFHDRSKVKLIRRTGESDEIFSSRRQGNNVI